MPGSNPYSQALASGVSSRISGSLPDPGVDVPRPNDRSVLDFLSGGAGAVVSGLFSLLGSYEQRKASERLLRQQRDWQLEDWKRETEYNSPGAVMARMASAGLNPDLLQGGNTSNAAMPNQGSVPSLAEASGIDVGGINAAAAARLQFRLNKDLLESEIALKKAQARDLDASAKQRGDTTELSKQQVAIQDALAKSHINVDDATVKNLAKEFEVLQSQIDVNDSVKQLNTAKALWESMSANERLNLIRAQTRQSNNSADLSFADAQRISKLVDAELAKLQAEGVSIDADNFFGNIAKDARDRDDLIGDAGFVINGFLHVLSHMLRISR